MFYSLKQLNGNYYSQIINIQFIYIQNKLPRTNQLIIIGEDINKVPKRVRAELS